MNGVVRSEGGGSPTTNGNLAKTQRNINMPSSVIQPPGIGPAIHLNGSAVQVQERDQNAQVRKIIFLLLQTVKGLICTSSGHDILTAMLFVKGVAQEYLDGTGEGRVRGQTP